MVALRRHARPACVPDPHAKHVLRRVLQCRTRALGAHLCRCGACGWQAPAYNSCRDRHCPQCQGRATHQWLQARRARMLDTPHFQVVFTLPAALRPLASANPRLLYSLMFDAASSVLRDLADTRLEARLGMTAVLHTWTRDLTYHPHVHVLVTAGGLHHDDNTWVPTHQTYLFPQRVMGALFRGRVLAGLRAALEHGALELPVGQHASDLRRLLKRLGRRATAWIVHVEPPRGRPVTHVARYLARYVKRVAVSDARMVAIGHDTVTFQGRSGPVQVTGAEFVRRFLLHVLPPGFRKVRHYGLYAPGGASRRLEVARGLVAGTSGGSAPTVDDLDVGDVGDELEACPSCGERAMRRLHPGSIALASARARGPP